MYLKKKGSLITFVISPNNLNQWFFTRESLVSGQSSFQRSCLENSPIRLLSIPSVIGSNWFTGGQNIFP
jgi:hypothetical protein